VNVQQNGLAWKTSFFQKQTVHNQDFYGTVALSSFTTAAQPNDTASCMDKQLSLKTLLLFWQLPFVRTCPNKL